MAVINYYLHWNSSLGHIWKRRPRTRSGMCTQQWECLLWQSLSLLQVRCRCSWVFFPQLQLFSHLPMQGKLKGTVLNGALSTPNLSCQGSWVPVPGTYYQLPHPWKRQLWPGPPCTQNPQSHTNFYGPCISAVQSHVLGASQMKTSDLPSRVNKSPTEEINTINLRIFLFFFLISLIFEKVAKPGEEVQTLSYGNPV